MTSKETTNPQGEQQCSSLTCAAICSRSNSSGITVTAVMPEELFSIYDPNVRLTRVNYPSVKVEMREPPALPRIIQAGKSGFCGPGY
jgi:hypothetical protein